MRFNAAGNRWGTLRLISSANQKDWLSRRGSLIQHLQTLGPVSVRVLRESVDQGWPDESPCLHLPAAAPVWLREVLLLVDQTPLVAAHIITPLLASCSVWRAIRQLRSQPLAQVLYDHRQFHCQRSAFAYRQVGPAHPLYRLVRRNTDEYAHPLVARRSVFVRGGAPLLVTECMLTALWRV